MHRTLRRLQLTYQRSIHNWRTFLVLMRRMHHRAELERLIRWAKRKRLPGPTKCYQSRLLDEEQRLAAYALRDPQLAAWARVAYHWWSHLNPPSCYPRRGSATRYRRATT